MRARSANAQQREAGDGGHIAGWNYANDGRAPMLSQRLYEIAVVVMR